MENKMQIGKVFLVGAGPGDAGLLTIKGEKILKSADVIVYDSLVGAGVLAMMPDTAEKINVGKRASNHTMPQEQINRLLYDKALEGKRVVRLKGGDPFLFGRGGEELELLSKDQIPFEVIPGVTSSIAVPAYNGIPVTHRDFTSSLHIITGHKRAGQSYDINFKALVDTRGTLVFLMGVSALKDICLGLIEGGMEESMPAAILSRGTTAGQKRIVATVGTLPAEVEKRGIETPAIIVIGKVCSLADDFFWYERLPLFGKKILITRPKELISSMAERLTDLGAEVLSLPAIKTEAIPENDALKKAFEKIGSYSWLVFTSPSGVRIFFEQLVAYGADIRLLGKVRCAVIGEGTAKELLKHGIHPDLMPDVYDGEHLGEALAQVLTENDRVLIPRARIGNPQLTEMLSDFTVDDVPLYDTLKNVQEELDIKGLVDREELFCAAFTSSSSVRSFTEAYPNTDFSALRAACIGKQTMNTAQSFGMNCEMSEKATMDSLIRLICEMK